MNFRIILQMYSRGYSPPSNHINFIALLPGWPVVLEWLAEGQRLEQPPAVLGPWAVSWQSVASSGLHPRTPPERLPIHTRTTEKPGGKQAKIEVYHSLTPGIVLGFSQKNCQVKQKCFSNMCIMLSYIEANGRELENLKSFLKQNLKTSWS